MTDAQKREVIDWAIQKIQDFEKEKKLYNWSAIILSLLDVICGIIALFYVGMLATSVIASILCGSVWGARTIQVVKVEKLAQALKTLTVPSLMYLATRKKRGEIMNNIKIKNWIIAGVDVAAIIVGVVLAFIEPNALTDNIVAVITGLGALLGVNVAIPCFNNAKVTAEEKEQIAVAKQAKVAKKEAKKEIKKAQQELIKLKTAEILEAKATENAKIEEIHIENQVINAEKVEVNNANIDNTNVNQQ